MGFIKGLLKFCLGMFLIFILLIALTIGGFWGYKKWTQHQLEQELASKQVDQVMTRDNLLEQNREILIEEEGMTVGEKLDLGLNPSVDDSDGDGLRDKDELEKYKTDPTKFSTVGDGISDMVKVAEGIDPSTNVGKVEEYKIEKEKLGLTLYSTSLNDKYFSIVEPYTVPSLIYRYKPVVQPIQVKNFEGEIEYTYPDNVTGEEQLKVYRFNFETEEMEEVENVNQDLENNHFKFSIRGAYPHFILTEGEVEKKQSTHYYFRLTGFELLEYALGYDHEVFIFNEKLIGSSEYTEEQLTDETYGTANVSKQEIGKVQAVVLDNLFTELDSLFADYTTNLPKDNFLQKGGIFDWGTVKGTEEDAYNKAMPWLALEAAQEEEETICEIEKSDKETCQLVVDKSDWDIVDSGFDTSQHAFSFDNVSTLKGPGGICKGFSRVTEKIYNDKTVLPMAKYVPSNALMTLYGSLNTLDGNFDMFTTHYNLVDDRDHYTFLDDGILYDYKFTDPGLIPLTDGDPSTNLSNEDHIDPRSGKGGVLNPEDFTDPDMSLLEMLETHYMIGNDKQIGQIPYWNTQNAGVIKQVRKKLSQGKILSVGIDGPLGGHAINVYKYERDPYNPDVVRLYVYDNNIPAEVLERNGVDELYMTIYLEKEAVLDDGKVKYKEKFKFDYTPFNSKTYYFRNTTPETEDYQAIFNYEDVVFRSLNLFNSTEF